MNSDTVPDWNELLALLPGSNFLQTTFWATVKAAVGWESHQKKWRDENGDIFAVANILIKYFSIKGIKLPWCILYIPRGPIMDWQNHLQVRTILQDLAQFAQHQHAIFIKIDPEVCIGTGMPGSEDETISASGMMVTDMLSHLGWKYSQDQIQFKNTVLIDLRPSTNEILNAMKQKTRYNIRLAERKGVFIHKAEPAEFDTLYRMYAETSLRDRFVIRSQDYYQLVWHTFYEAGLMTPLIAKVNDEPVAGLMLFHFNKTAWYVYGMSREIHRNLMPTYLLQWHAIETAKQMGCETYDLWGAPDIFDEQDPMWGVYRFKQGLGGKTIRTIGAYDLPIKPLIYKLYLDLLPKILRIIRKKGFQKTKQGIST